MNMDRKTKLVEKTNKNALIEERDPNGEDEGKEKKKKLK